VPIEPYLYLLPALLSMLVWVYWPLAQTGVLSLYQWNLVPATPMVFVGAENYRRVITLPEMGIAVRNTLVYTIGMLVCSVILPLAVAILIADLRGRMRDIYRTIMFTPVLLAPVVVAIIWRWILNPLQGVINTTLDLLFGTGRINWLGTPATALWVIIAVTGWKLLGFSVLIFSAGIANINRDYLAAASVDGASKWEQTRYIVLPLLSPTISFMVLLTIILTAQWTFPLIDVLTQGGPLDATTNVYYILWQFAFRSFNVGWSAAAAVLFFFVFALVAWAFLWLSERLAFYDS
jgi:multiple sugar transport system permease protein